MCSIYTIFIKYFIGLDINEWITNSTSQLACILIYLLYFILLLHQYIVIFPIKQKIDQKCIETQEISKEQISEKFKYISTIGVLMIGGNLLVIFIVTFLNIKKITTFYGISEVFCTTQLYEYLFSKMQECEWPILYLLLLFSICSTSHLLEIKSKLKESWVQLMDVLSHGELCITDKKNQMKIM